jgi:hypothetical protein
MHVMPSAAVSSVPLTLDGQTQNENHKTVSVLIGATHSGNSDPILCLASLGATAMFVRLVSLLRVLPSHVTSDVSVLNNCQVAP